MTHIERQLSERSSRNSKSDSTPARGKAKAANFMRCSIREAPPRSLALGSSSKLHPGAWPWAPALRLGLEPGRSCQAGPRRTAEFALPSLGQPRPAARSPILKSRGFNRQILREPSNLTEGRGNCRARGGRQSSSGEFDCRRRTIRAPPRAMIGKYAQLRGTYDTAPTVRYRARLLKLQQCPGLA